MSINPPSLAEFLTDKARIKKLESKILALNQMVASLRKELGKKSEINKSKLIDLLVKGSSAERAARLSGCSKSTADRIKRQLVEAGQINQTPSKKIEALQLIEQGLKDAEIAKRLKLSCGYIRNIKSETRPK